MMKTENIMYTVAREGYARRFKNRDTAKAVYKKWKAEFPETVLRKIVTRIDTLVYDDKSECWL